MASQNQQESNNEDARCNNTTLDSSANLVPMNCLNINQCTNDNEKCHKGEARKRSFMEMETGEEEKRIKLDLNLRLTPPGLQQKARLPSNQYSEISSTSSSMPLNLDSSSEEVEFGNTRIEDPSLILMGCSRCLIYVMVSEVSPKCPNCHSSILIDIFRNSFGKKSRNF